MQVLLEIIGTIYTLSIKCPEFLWGCSQVPYDILKEFRIFCFSCPVGHLQLCVLRQTHFIPICRESRTLVFSYIHTYIHIHGSCWQTVHADSWTSNEKLWKTFSLFRKTNMSRVNFNLVYIFPHFPYWLFIHATLNQILRKKYQLIPFFYINYLTLTEF